MKQQDVFKKIGGIIKELNEQYEYLQSAPGRLNDLELELFLANSHFLTDHVLILGKLNSQNNPVPMPAPVQEEKYFEPLVQPLAPAAKNTPAELPAEEIEAEANDFNEVTAGINLEEESIEDSYSFAQEEPETIRHELIIDDSDWEDDAEYEEELKQEPVVEEIDDSPVVLNLPVTATNEEIKPVVEMPVVLPPTTTPNPVREIEHPEVLTINQKMSAALAGEKSAIAGQLHAQKISDLKTAINLNDKLLYIKDLFNGYSLAYSEAIDILNRFTGLDEADLFLKKNYVAKNGWDDKPETTGKFYALLKRRYA